MAPQRKFLVHGKDQSGDEWIVGTDRREVAEDTAKRFCQEGHTGVRITDTTTGQVTQVC